MNNVSWEPSYCSPLPTSGCSNMMMAEGKDHDPCLVRYCDTASNTAIQIQAVSTLHTLQRYSRATAAALLQASDYGMKLPILRSNTEDQILYQTERYNEETFGYEVPIKEEGDYVVVLKFAEVYFAQSQQKVFDVRLNGHVVVKDLDIFDRVGHSTAHDEIIPISIRKGKLSVQGEVSTFTGKLHIEFVKGYYDNPKICALYILQGTVDDVPKLQPHPGLEKKEDEEDEEEYDEGSSVKKQANKNRVQSGPRTPNPYASDNSSLMFPILVAFGVFIPTLFCLCRL
ncbi:malectin isoform X1 [Lepidochelys kempii]|uniref:malectin isoform X1 n=1 Tax=Lepidochelys kempii TaxID=8472 RepID=UPI003C6FEAE6